MKKTLIALIALAGVATAETTSFNPLKSTDNWTLNNNNKEQNKSTAPVLNSTDATLTYTSGDWSQGYAVYTFDKNQPLTLTRPGDNVEVKFTIESTNADTLVTGAIIGGGKAIVLGQGSYSDKVAGSNNQDCVGITAGITTTVDGNFYQMQSAGTKGVYVSPTEGSQKTGLVWDNGSAKPQSATLTTTIAWSEEANKFVATLKYNEESWVSYELGESYTLEKLVFSLDGAHNTTQKVSGLSVTYAIPEPATATLSLLALCGLAARRRRK